MWGIVVSIIDTKDFLFSIFRQANLASFLLFCYIGTRIGRCITYKFTFMDSSGLNEVVISKILGNIPPNIKPMDYLMETLDISKESVYRRLRGDIPFTFGEIVKLSLNLSFSIDEIIGQNKKSRIFFDLIENISYNPQQTFLALLMDYHRYLLNVRNAKRIDTILAVNRILMWLTLESTYLFRFFYFKWAHQTYKAPANYSFSEVYISPDINVLCQKINEDLQFTYYASYIIDRKAIVHTIKEIQYYYRRKLITTEELLLIKDDLLAFINQIEAMAKTGVTSVGSPVYIFLSMINVESNSLYTSYDDKAVSYFWIYSLSPASVNNEAACLLHKKWLDSLKRYSMLISQSNEMLQEEFFNKQRSYINSIENEML